MTKSYNTYNTYATSFNDPFKFIDNFWTTATASTADTYPPYNVIELDEDTRVLELAVAGFNKSEISVLQDNKKLVISAEKSSKDEKKYLHKGIAYRKFHKEYALWEYWNIQSVDLNDGILYIVIKRELPEEKKPKKFEIK